MKTRNPFTILTAATLAILAASAQATTTTFSGSGTDGWNTATNWDAGVPAGAVDAVVSSAATASVDNAATPTYTGSLTLNDNSTLKMAGAAGSEKAVTAVSGITMRAGSKIQVNLNANISFPPITLAGNAALESLFGASDHQTDNFAAITGAHTLTISGFNNHTYNLNAANSFSKLISNAIDRYNIRAKAAGSLGTGDVTVTGRADGRSAQLYLDVANTIADTATLTLNGKGYDAATQSRITIATGVNETVAALIVDGVPMAPGTYNNTQAWLTGNGTLSVVPITPDNPAPAFGTIVPAGAVELTWTNVTPNTGSDVWVDVWFGTDPAALAKMTSTQLNLETFTVSAPVGDSYYWRVDSYLGGAPTGTPITGTVFNFVVVDTDGDGFPDDYEWTHTNPQSTIDLNREDDNDYDGSDGLTNWEEYQLGTDPTKSDTDGDTLKDGAELSGVGARPATDPTKWDTDGDGLNDGIESNTGSWGGAANTGTDPTNPDTDADGLQDGVENNTDSYVNESQTGTDPLDADSDDDNAGDWYEIAASHTDPNNPAEKPSLPYPLPDPDPADAGAPDKPVKVYIMSGQSNMVGAGAVSGTGDGTLETMTVRQNKFPDLLDGTGGWTTRQDVRYRGVISDFAKVQLSPGTLGSTFGPELGFGYVMGWHHDAPVLLLKSCTGNRSLGWDVLPPGSPSYQYEGSQYAGYGQSATGGTPGPGEWYAGKEFDRFFMDESEWAHASSPDTNVVDVLDNFATEYPDWADQGFEIAGFVWWQGDKDRYDMGLATKYKENLVNLIDSLRAYYENRYNSDLDPLTNTVTGAPFVLATLGQTPLYSTNEAERAILDAQLAVDGESGNYPQYAGNVKTVYSHPLSEGGASNSHYNGRAGTYLLVGDALGRAMVELESSATATDYDNWATNYPAADLSDPAADYDGDGLTNDYERIFGLNPTSGRSANPISVPLNAAAGTFSYTRRDDALSKLNFEIWTSTDLSLWTKDAGAGQIEGSVGPDGVETVAVELSADLLLESKLFVQVRATD